MGQGSRWCAAVVAVAILATPVPARAPDKNKDAFTDGFDLKAQEAKVWVTLRDVINRGADLYNSGEMTACYRLYEGSLLTVRPMFDYKPDLQKAISAALTTAERDPVVWRRAFTLRSALDKIRAEVNPKKLPAPIPADKNPDPEKKPDPDKNPDPDKKPADKKPDDKKPGEKKPGEKKLDKDLFELDPPRPEKNPDDKSGDTVDAPNRNASNLL